MEPIVVMRPEDLREIVRQAVKEGVCSAISTLHKKTPREMNDTEAAEYIGVKVATMRSWRIQKKGPKYHKSGRSVRYAKQDLDIWLAQSEVLTIDSMESGHGTCRL